MTAFALQSWWLAQRRIEVMLRQPGYLLVALIQPVIWLFGFGSLFRRVVELPGFGTSSYLDYLVPGVVVMSALSTTMWSGLNILEEMERGTLNRFLVAPIRRSAIVSGVFTEQALSTALQSLLIVLLGWAGGARYPGGLGGVAVLTAAAVLLGVMVSALSTALGLMVRQRETLIALNTFLLLPLTFLSSAFMARDLMPPWIGRAAALNPVNWALDAGRAALGDRPDWWTQVLVPGGRLFVLTGLAVGLSLRTFRSYQKSV
ncbi:ABC transporter permease [Streptomyces sp. NPDC002577]